MGIVLIIYVALCVLVGYFGRDRKLGLWGYLALSLILTPLMGLLAVLVSDKRSSE